MGYGVGQMRRIEPCEVAGSARFGFAFGRTAL